MKVNVKKFCLYLFLCIIGFVSCVLGFLAANGCRNATVVITIMVLLAFIIELIGMLKNKFNGGTSH